MELTREEETALAGGSGDGLMLAYKILVAIGNANNATKLIPIKWAHISGVNYNTIGDAGVKFLSELDKKSKVTVTTTLNPMGYDPKQTNNLSENFKSNQTSIVNSYLSLGVNPSFTCIPYEVFDLPKEGEIVSFAESNAAVFLNSILEVRTNKESALSSLASAITGKTPYSDLLIDEIRKPNISIKPDIEIKTELDFGLLGYFAGKISKEVCIGLGIDPKKLDIMKLKALSAGIGTSGMCGMFNNEINDCEQISFGKSEIEQIRDDLNTAEDGDLIIFGSPQLGQRELEFLNILMEGKKFTKKCIIFCARSIAERECNNKLINRLRRANVNVVCDSCTCLTPLITKNDYDSIVTNSIKCAYYMKHSNKIDVALKNIKSIIKQYSE